MGMIVSPPTPVIALNDEVVDVNSENFKVSFGSDKTELEADDLAIEKENVAKICEDGLDLEKIDSPKSLSITSPQSFSRPVVMGGSLVFPEKNPFIKLFRNWVGGSIDLEER